MAVEAWLDPSGRPADLPGPADLAVGVGEPWQPAAMQPEEATPPAGVDRALPLLGPFAALVGPDHERYKLAVLCALAQQPEASWRLHDAKEAVPWLEAESTARVVGELAGTGLLLPAPDGAGAWRLSDEAHVVAAVCSALSAPQFEHDRIVRVLAATVTLARAAGAPDEAAFGPFLAAAGVLERDLDAIERRIANGQEEALLEVAANARIHAADMAALLQQHAELFTGAGGLADAWERAVAALSRLETLTDEVVATLSGKADDKVRRGPRSDRRSLRGLVAASDLATLAALAGEASPPPAVAPTHPGAALAALDEHLGRPDPLPVPIPEPVSLPMEPPEDIPDFTTLAAQALEWLAGRGEAVLTEWVVGGSWAEATGRMAAVVEAWSRHGPGGDGTLRAELHASPALDAVGHDEVAAVSRTLVRRPAGEELAP
ncbi:MAG TPA: hypothetical protein VG276_09790 [Actinomycetes bacterium]|nr:hypothetical protein [Actinomycetes bacterium]